MSPEQKKGIRCDAKADMYSLGITLFEMAYGPFTSDSGRFVALMGIREDSKLPKDFDKRCGASSNEVRFVYLDSPIDITANRPRSD